MKKYAVDITRVETRIVWARDLDDAQDVALELDGAQIRDENEETTDVRVCDAPDDAMPINRLEDVMTHSTCHVCGLDIEWSGEDWRDRGNGTDCLPFVNRGEVVIPEDGCTHQP